MQADRAGRYVLELSLGYYQFCLADLDAAKEAFTSIAGTIWDGDEAWRRWVTVAPGFLVVMSEDPSQATVILIVQRADPGIPPADWDLIVDASVDIPSGHLVVGDFGNVPDEVDTITVPPGCYRVRVHHTFQPRPPRELFSVVPMGELDAAPFVIVIWLAPYADPMIHRAPGST